MYFPRVKRCNVTISNEIITNVNPGDTYVGSTFDNVRFRGTGIEANFYNCTFNPNCNFDSFEFVRCNLADCTGLDGVRKPGCLTVITPIPVKKEIYNYKIEKSVYDKFTSGVKTVIDKFKEIF